MVLKYKKSPKVSPRTQKERVTPPEKQLSKVKAQNQARKTKRKKTWTKCWK